MKDKPVNYIGNYSKSTGFTPLSNLQTKDYSLWESSIHEYVRTPPEKFEIPKLKVQQVQLPQTTRKKGITEYE